MSKNPTSDIDLFSSAAMADPYYLYAELRRAGGAVWLPRIEMWAVSRHADVMAVLQNDQVYTSSSGVTLNPEVNTFTGNVITTDRPLHTKLRSLVAEQLMPAALKKLSEKIEAEADALVERLVGLGQFDAVQDLSWHLPLTVVTDLVGVPPSYGKRLIEFAEIMFDWAGPPGYPITEAAVKRLPETQELRAHLTDRKNLRLGSMGMALFEAADRGDIEAWRAPLLMMDYLGPSLDTTIAGTGSAIWLFANNQSQWDSLRGDPTRVGAAVDEALRLESPIQYFSRVANSDQSIDGTTIAAGDRVLVMYGSANRDSAKWPSADSMDISRGGLGGQLAFGAGIHSCAGRNLAKAEISALLRALLKRVKAFRITDAQRRQAHVMRSFAHLQVEAVPV